MVSKKEFIKKYVICIVFVEMLTSCVLFGDSGAPYMVSGEMVLDVSRNYEIAGLNLILLNKSELDIQSFTLVFYMFDEDGNIPYSFYGKNNVVIELDEKVPAGKILECTLSLDNYLWEVPEQPYEIDYLYLSKIVYSDGSTWSDALGLMAFN